MIFLQKARDAKRIYSTVLYSKTNCDGKFNLILIFLNFIRPKINSLHQVIFVQPLPS